jgi:hypothetical protein
MQRVRERFVGRQVEIRPGDGRQRSGNEQQRVVEDETRQKELIIGWKVIDEAPGPYGDQRSAGGRDQHQDPDASAEHVVATR